MQLFQLLNYQVIFEPQTMMISEFAAIRDKNNDNDLTLKEISFIWFYTDIRSDFQNILDDNERKEEVKNSIGLDLSWEPSDEVSNAIDFYKSYSKTPSSGLYNSSMITAAYIEKQLKSPETLLSTLDARGNPVYKLDNLLKLLKDIPVAMEKLHSAREQVIKEIESQSSLKGNREKAIMEDGI